MRLRGAVTRVCAAAMLAMLACAGPPAPAAADDDTDPPTEELAVVVDKGASPEMPPGTADPHPWHAGNDPPPGGLASADAPESAGDIGPDTFGYTMSDPTPFIWQSPGTTDAGVAGDDVSSGPLPIGFTFRFYGKSYTLAYLSSNGLLSFEAPHTDFANPPIPWNRDQPRAFVAGFWDDLIVGGAANTGKVYYRTEGSPGNRFFVATWSDVGRTATPAQRLTFQIVLYEGGGINISYQSVSGPLNSATVGIEDSYAEDGLQASFNANGRIASAKSLYFNYPGPRARAHVRPIYSSRLTSASRIETFGIRIRNTADDAADRYDLSVTGAAWPTTVTDAGGAALPGNRTPSVAAGATLNLSVRVTVPATATAGASSRATVTARSVRDAGKQGSVTVQAAVPQPYAQAARDPAFQAPALDLVRPSGPFARPLEAVATEAAVAERSSGGFAHAWQSSVCYGARCGAEARLDWLNACAQPVRGTLALSNESAGAYPTFNRSPVTAAAPNGRVAVAWQRYELDAAPESDRYRYNVFATLLDSGGSVVTARLNLTNNAAWGTVPGQGQQFLEPAVGATGNNRFVVAWVRLVPLASGYERDVYYAVIDAAGAVVKPATKLTNSTPNVNAFWAPQVIPLSGNRALLTYYNWSSGVTFSVIDSAGAVLHTSAGLGGGAYFRIAGAQLSGSRALLAWAEFNGPYTQIRHAAIDTNTYAVVRAAQFLPVWPNTLGGNFPMVSPDPLGGAVVVFEEGDTADTPGVWKRALHYARFDASGNLVVQAMVARVGAGASPFIRLAGLTASVTTFTAHQSPKCATSLPIAARPSPFFEGPYEREPNNSFAQANGPVRFARDYAGDSRADGADPNFTKDFFWFRADAAGTVSLEFDTPSADGQLQLFDAAFIRLDAVTTPPFRLTRAVPAGTYYVYVTTAINADPGQAPYRLRVNLP